MTQMTYAGIDAVAEWEAALQEKREKYPTDPARAVRALVRERPELHLAYLEAYNAERGRRVRRGG